MTLDSILKYKNNEQKNFFERNQNIKKEVRGEEFENGMQYFSFFPFYQFADTIKKLNNSENLNYFIGIDEGRNAQFIYKKISEHLKDLKSGKEINIMILDHSRFHYVNYQIRQNEKGEIEIRLFDSLSKNTVLLDKIKKYYDKKEKKTKIFDNEKSDSVTQSRQYREKELGIPKEDEIQIQETIKFSIGYAPQQDDTHYNCGEHAFTQNALKDLFKQEKELLKHFTIIKYTNKQEETNCIYAFLIGIAILFRRMFTNTYKHDSQKMFKLIDIIAEISVLEQNANAVFKELEIKDCDIVKDLKTEILNEIKKEFGKKFEKKNYYSNENIKNTIHSMFKDKINEKIKEFSKLLSNENEKNIMKSLEKYDEEHKEIKVRDEVEFLWCSTLITQEELLKGKDTDGLNWKIKEMNREMSNSNQIKI